MLILAALLWAPLPLLPFLPLSAGAKVALGGVLFVAVQIAWWGGTALVGPIMVQRIYAAFRSFWRRRKL